MAVTMTLLGVIASLIGFVVVFRHVLRRAPRLTNEDVEDASRRKATFDRHETDHLSPE